jgi:DNA polymerase (family 10)
MVSINPDAHSTGEIDHLKWGIAMARKGGVSPDRVLNCMDITKITRFLTNKRSRIGKAVHA